MAIALVFLLSVICKLSNSIQFFRAFYHLSLVTEVRIVSPLAVEGGFVAARINIAQRYGKLHSTN